MSVKFSDFTPEVAPSNTDEVVGLVGGNNARMPLSSLPISDAVDAALTAIGVDAGLALAAAGRAEDAATTGWSQIGPETSTPFCQYVSATSFRINGEDWTDRIEKGDKIRFVNPGTKYFYVIGVQYTGGNTVVTVTGGSDYSVANSAIDDPFFSKAVSPVGFPQWFNWSPTWVGFSVNPTGVQARFYIVGKTCSVFLTASGAGTSNSTALTASLPVTAGGPANFIYIGNALGYDNGAFVTTPSKNFVFMGTPTVWTFSPSYASGNWTASGGKYIQYAVCQYQI